MILNLLFGLSSAHAVPLTLTQQGRLLDNNGVAVSGTHTVAVRIFDDEIAGNLIWQEIMAEDFINGYYAIILGADSFNPLDDTIFDNGDLHLEIELDNGGPLLPRTPFVSTPYALRAKVAQGVDGGEVNANSVSIGGNMVIDGSGHWVGPASTTNWADIANVPGDLADGDDDSLAGISCNSGQILGWNGSTWACTADNGLTEAEVEAFVTNDPLDLASGTTLGGDVIVTNATLGNTLDNTNCGQGEILSYDSATGWACTNFSQMLDADNDGVLSWNDCDDNDPSLLGMSIDADCDGAMTGIDCNDNDPNSTTQANDADCDTYITLSDCNDNDPNMPANDMDCDGVATVDDCDDNDPALWGIALDADCDGTQTALDCDDTDPTSTTQANDADCDGYVSGSDCNDGDANMPVNDMDCDGVSTADDCDDNNTGLLDQANDNDCDGVPAGLDCDDNDAANTSSSNCGVFSNCVNNWCYQQGTLDQFTKCDSVTNGGNTCINPEIKYGSTTGGIPHEHNGNQYDTWCQQLGGSGYVSHQLGNRDGCQLFGCTGYDESNWHWCDWSNGSWYNSTCDANYGASSSYIDRITCY